MMFHNSRVTLLRTDKDSLTAAAVVEHYNENRVTAAALISYSTAAALYVPSERRLYYAYYSMTTSKHLRLFKQYLYYDDIELVKLSSDDMERKSRDYGFTQ